MNQNLDCFQEKYRQSDAYYRFSDKLSILSFCIIIWFVTASLIQSLSGRKRESSVWNYFKFEKGLNKSQCSIVDEKERRHVKCGLWIFKSFQDFEVWTETRTKNRTKMIRGIRTKTRTKMICRIEIVLKLKWLLPKNRNWTKTKLISSWTE